MQTPLGSLFRFGPFQVNSVSGELLKNGNRVKLQEQPFRLLVVLLENAGQVVTRDDLRHRIWQDDTFVDFDSSLRVAVRKLREALGDDAENPRYVETIPKRGYRFLTPEIYSELVTQRVGDLGTNQASTAIVTPADDSGTRLARRSTRRRRWIFASVLFLIALAGVLITFRAFGHRKVLTERDTVVLADFANSTGDPVFDGTLRQGMAVQLGQSPFLSLLSEDRAQQELRLMGQPADARVTPQIAQEVCVRTGSAAVLAGSIARVGTEYVLGLHAKDCQTGAMLSEDQAQAARKEDVLNTLSRMAGNFRTNIGESLATVEKHNTPLDEATTPSLDALKAYSEGWKVMRVQGEAAGAPFFKHAIEIDPKFAIAYAWLGVIHSSIGEPELAAAYERKAYDLRDRANDRERFMITAYYDGRVTGNMEKAQQTCETWATIYPRDDGPPSFLSGFIYPTLAEYEKGAAAGEKLIEFNPDYAVGYFHHGFNLLALDRLEEAEDTFQKSNARGLDAPHSLILQHEIAFLKGDKAEMDRLVAKTQGRSGAEDWMSDHQAAALAFAGHLQQARMLSQHAIDMAQHAGYEEHAGFYATREALREAFYGNTHVAMQRARKARELAKGREVEYGTAFALALSGDSSTAEAMANDLEKRFPEDTAVRFSYLPALRARLALNHRDPSGAIELLQGVRYELGSPRSALNAFFGAMYPVYVRGQAYLAARKGAEAAAEFQKILNHRGIVVSDPIGAVARLQLGRAYVLSGDTTRARLAYQDFLALWKDADPGLPILKQAKTEYAKLQ